jgi:hypothetical protein
VSNVELVAEQIAVVAVVPSLISGEIELVLGLASDISYSFSGWVGGSALIFNNFGFVIGVYAWTVNCGAFSGVVSTFDEGRIIFLVVGIFGNRLMLVGGSSRMDIYNFLEIREYLCDSIGSFFKIVFNVAVLSGGWVVSACG